MIETFDKNDKLFRLNCRNLAQFILGGEIRKDGISKDFWNCVPIDRLNSLLEKHGVYVKNGGDTVKPFYVVLHAYPIV